MSKQIPIAIVGLGRASWNINIKRSIVDVADLDSRRPLGVIKMSDSHESATQISGAALPPLFSGLPHRQNESHFGGEAIRP